MAGKELLHKIKMKAGLSSTPPETGKGKGKKSKHITHGFNLVKGKSGHAMEDYVVSEFRQKEDDELGLFAIFDGHMGHDVANYLRTHLFDNILKEKDFWSDTEAAIKRAYHKTDVEILEKSLDLGKGGSTAVTAILINGQLLVVANVGDSRAIMCQNGEAEQLSVDHEPSREKEEIESRGGFVTNIPGDVPRVDGRLAVARAFGDKSLKIHLSSEPDVAMTLVDDKTEFLILASDGLWKVMTNREVLECVRNVKDAQSAAKRLTDEAVSRKSKDDISVIVAFITALSDTASRYSSDNFFASALGGISAGDTASPDATHPAGRRSRRPSKRRKPKPPLVVPVSRCPITFPQASDPAPHLPQTPDPASPSRQTPVTPQSIRRPLQAPPSVPIPRPIVSHQPWTTSPFNESPYSPVLTNADRPYRSTASLAFHRPQLPFTARIRSPHKKGLLLDLPAYHKKDLSDFSTNSHRSTT